MLTFLSEQQQVLSKTAKEFQKMIAEYEEKVTAGQAEGKVKEAGFSYSWKGNETHMLLDNPKSETAAGHQGVKAWVESILSHDEKKKINPDIELVKAMMKGFENAVNMDLKQDNSLKMR